MTKITTQSGLGKKGYLLVPISGKSRGTAFGHGWIRELCDIDRTQCLSLWALQSPPLALFLDSLSSHDDGKF